MLPPLEKTPFLLPFTAVGFFAGVALPSFFQISNSSETLAGIITGFVTSSEITQPLLTIGSFIMRLINGLILGTFGYLLAKIFDDVV